MMNGVSRRVSKVFLKLLFSHLEYLLHIGGKERIS
jgi:hypothetical protein